MGYIDCRQIANEINEKTKTLLNGETPRIIVFAPINDTSVKSYIQSLNRVGEQVGISVAIQPLSKTVELQRAAFEGTAKIGYAGILMLSEPPELYPSRKFIPEHLNVEGNDHDDDITKLFCTARACLTIMEVVWPSIEGYNAVVVGYGKRVGKPLSYLLMRKHIGTVTTTHRYTDNLHDHTIMAHIIISAVGKKNLITANMVTHGALIIDVGGDVHPDCAEKARVTPAVGGVGPVTAALLMRNAALALRIMTHDDSHQHIS